MTGVVPLAVLFPDVLSPPPLTDALLVRLAGAVADTLTVSVIAGDRERAVWGKSGDLGGRRSVQKKTDPVTAAAVRPVGSVTTTVTVPLVGPLPVTFDTVSV